MWHFKAQQESYETKCLPHVWPAMPGLPNAGVLRRKRELVQMYEVQWLHNGILRYSLLWRASGIPQHELHGYQFELWFCLLCHRKHTMIHVVAMLGPKKKLFQFDMCAIQSCSLWIPLYTVYPFEFDSARIWLDDFFWAGAWTTNMPMLLATCFLEPILFD